MLVCFKASIIEFEYARTNPPEPNLIPPKYRITIATILDKLFFFKIFNIGIPAVPEGSPSSQHFYIAFLFHL